MCHFAAVAFVDDPIRLVLLVPADIVGALRVARSHHVLHRVDLLGLVAGGAPDDVAATRQHRLVWYQPDEDLRPADAVGDRRRQPAFGRDPGGRDRYKRDQGSDAQPCGRSCHATRSPKSRRYSFSMRRNSDCEGRSATTAAISSSESSGAEDGRATNRPVCNVSITPAVPLPPMK